MSLSGDGGGGGERLRYSRRLLDDLPLRNRCLQQRVIAEHGDAILAAVLQFARDIRLER